MGAWRVPEWREVYRKRYGLSATTARKCSVLLFRQLDACKDDEARRLLIPNQHQNRRKEDGYVE